jgi:hypothetical protein
MTQQSNWEVSKSQSNYHFDPFRHEPEGYAYQYCGRIVGNWNNELEKAIKFAEPKSWGNRGKSYHPDHPDRIAEENDLIRAGVDKNITIFRKNFEFSGVLDRMCAIFGLQDVKRAMHVQFPGEMLHLHIDKQYEMNNDPELVRRFFIMLSDWTPGQFLQFGNRPVVPWRAGDIYTFDWKNIPHASANASWTPRPLIQITGTITEQTRALLHGFIREHPVS